MSSDEAPLVEEETVEAPARRFNPRVLNVVCVTLLTCVLLACLAFTLCTLYKQQQEIHDLQRTSEKMDRYLDQWEQDAVMERRVPMKKVLRMDFDFTDFLATTEAPAEPLNSVDEERLEKLQKDLDEFTTTSQMKLRDLRNQTKRSNWKSFELWLRNWLIFQKARQHKPDVTTTTRALVLDSKCFQEARNASSLIGSYRPQCERWGGYKPVQCWPATGRCWCVDQTGAAINGTTRIGRPTCPRHHGSGLRN
ncbi:CD74 molecule, major histocompatibility complex, class II invariant chain b [Synchiropus splendidus]|uniref:CD74 molecule, major histocompatibility complex, class II invariant chain b n=1 Tax=Synchiropus splendidus TaxID=270530 RepID=UPI00237E3536|nr:CD74 molecule, major histocompatibility complex, class II invariant chain b [Synchiropus splendidus]